MKNAVKRGVSFCTLLVFLITSSLVMAQGEWDGNGTTTGTCKRSGTTYVGNTASPSASTCKLYVYHASSTDANISLGSPNGPSLRFTEGGTSSSDSTKNTLDYASLGFALSSNKFLTNSVSGDFVMRNNKRGGHILFGTRIGPSGGSGSVSEKMRLTDAGNLGIGTVFTSTYLPLGILHVHNATSMKAYFTGTTPSIILGEAYMSAPTTYASFNFATASNSFITGSATGDGVVISTGNLLFGLGSSPAEKVRITSAGFVGIGVTSPASKLHLDEGTFQITGSTGTSPDSTISGLTAGYKSTYAWIQTENNKPLALLPKTYSTRGNSYVAIGFVPGSTGYTGTQLSNYKLAVKGRIICEELRVKFSGNWSDYVFNKDYKLRDLSEVESYIEKNHHLPDVPSEEEIKATGFDAGQMDATILRKVEELTLYMIELNKQMEELKAKNQALEKKNQELDKKNEELTRLIKN